MKQPKTFADVVKAFGVRPVARSLRVYPSHVSRLARGIGRPSADLIERICNLYDIPAESFIRRRSRRAAETH
jgi:transcriptional regulator with XRE-family HTH domain